MDFDWRFSLADHPGAAMPAFDDSAWQRVDLPHDWSSGGPFSADLGSGNGYAPGGIGWYRKRFTLPAPELRQKLAAVEFDGVYDHAEVWCNGHFAGARPYGYASFECDLTPYLKAQGENVLAVRVDHSRYADSRWYTGSGIYRHVRLRFTDPLGITRWGTFVTTPSVSAESATVRIETTIGNRTELRRTLVLESDILSPAGSVAARVTSPAAIEPGAERTLVQEVSIARPQLWSTRTPVLYRVRNRIRAEGAIADETEVPFGIRSIRFDSGRGFLLNGTPLKIQGVCLHHDAGCLGAAVPAGVWERRLQALKELGVNAIRTSHNPPAPEFLDLCDRLGLLVKDEAFDEFTPPKNKWVSGWNNGVPSRFGYGEVFAEWSLVDMRDLVRRDRNHPSVIMWSIGNEIDYPNDPFSHPVLGKSYRPDNPPAADLVKWGKPLIDAVKQLDSTRPVTAGLASLAMSDAVGLADLLDVVGYNYQESRYDADHQRVPGRVIFGSENNHQFGNWTIVRDQAFVAGQFLWTGIDYLGEARAFPNRANGAGLLDLCGFKKPGAWFRQSLWSERPMAYLCAGGARTRGSRPEEHWNWPPGSQVAVSCYTNCDEVQLTLNGAPIGTKPAAAAEDGVLSWDVPYAPGVLKVLGSVAGKPAAEFELRTAGPASRIVLLPDVHELTAAGRAVCHVEVRVVDAQGVRVPGADPVLTFELTGPAVMLGIGNGDLNNVEDPKALRHKAFQGRALAILQAAGPPGMVVVKVSAPGLDPAVVELPVK